jgi:hypothetical protein
MDPEITAETSPKKSLHPTILFHFTKTKENLFGILEHTFKLSYAREMISGVNEKRMFAVPMVSFCDIKLHDIKDHIENYGSYGIGLTKDWANRQGLNPVLYTNSRCDLVDHLIKAFGNIYEHNETIDEPLEYAAMADTFLNMQNLYRYLKNYEGELYRSGKLVDPKYRFADEREWRFVPPPDSPGFGAFFPLSKVDTTEKKAVANQTLNHLSLHFEPDDIRYLIVKDDTEINELLEHLRIVKSRFDDLTIKRLGSRVLTAYQINYDI